jgi:hypothetical protein
MESRQRKKLPKRIIIPIMVLFAPIICCVLPVQLNTCYNDYRLRQFAKPLFEYPLPPETQVIEHFSTLGLFGNGNHCDFLVNQMMETTLTEEEIQNYYQDVKFPRILTSTIYEPMSPQIVFESSSHVPSKRIGTFFENSTPSEDVLAFVVGLGDVGNPPGLDLRCSG